MEKIKLDNFTFINVFNKNDFQNGETLQAIISSCEKIIKSYKEILDISSNMDEFKDNITNFFLSDLNLLTCILYSKKDCEPGKRKAISFVYFSSQDLENKNWKLESVYNRLNSDADFKKSLILSSFKYLKDKQAENITTQIKNINKEEQKFFDELKKDLFPSDQNDFKEELEKSYDCTNYSFNLKPFKFVFPKYDEKTA